MIAQEDGKPVLIASNWTSEACDHVVPEDVSFLIVCECANRSHPLIYLANAAILTGVASFVVLLTVLR